MSAVSADSLFRKSNNTQLKFELDNLTKTLDANIEKANTEGHSEIYFSLPVNFAITGLDRSDAQLVIYSRLIEIYERNGFKVKMKVRPDETIMNIKWIANFDENEKERMKRLFSSHLFK